MAGSPFKLKETAKEKEAQLPEKLPVTDKFSAEKIPTKDKHEKEKSEADKPHKDSKDQKDQKEQKENKDKQEKEKHEKEKQEKDGKNEAKDQHDKQKHEKELKDRKEISPKEHLAKEVIKDTLEKLPETKDPQSEAGMSAGASPEEAAAAASMSAQKIIEKTPFEKIRKDKDKFEKIEKIEKFEIKEFDKVIHDVKYQEVPPLGPVGPGPVEDRVAALEAAVAQLVHFIPENLRPDLSHGALRQEPDVQGQKPQGQKPEGQKPEGGGTPPAGSPAGSPAGQPAADQKQEGEKKK